MYLTYFDRSLILTSVNCSIMVLRLQIRYIDSCQMSVFVLITNRCFDLSKSIIEFLRWPMYMCTISLKEDLEC